MISCFIRINPGIKVRLPLKSHTVEDTSDFMCGRGMAFGAHKRVSFADEMHPTPVDLEKEFEMPISVGSDEIT